MTKNEIRERRAVLKKTHWQILVPRLLLGVIFTASGLNGFFNLIPEPQFSAPGAAFLEALREGGFYTLLKTAELSAGLLLLFNFAGQLGVLILVPICIGIVTFHWFLSPQGALLGWIALALELVMIAVYRKNFLKMFKGRDDDAAILHRHHERKEKSDLGDWVLDN